jgi:hypothetical protein
MLDTMFTPQERENIRNRIIEKARRDSRISGGAITGSLVMGKEDRWSDIDLAFGVVEKKLVEFTVSDFSQFMYDNYDCYHHLDVLSGEWIYRVFFLKNTLQVDIAFVQEEIFGARAPSFELVFGKSVAPFYNKPRSAEVLAGWAWLYALHVRSSFARKKFWQTEYFVSGMRDFVFSMMCLRYDLPTSDGRGIDSLPGELTGPLEAGLIRSLEPDEMCRAFEVTIDAFILELGRGTDNGLSDRLALGLRALVVHVKDLM